MAKLKTAKRKKREITIKNMSDVHNRPSPYVIYAGASVHEFVHEMQGTRCKVRDAGKNETELNRIPRKGSARPCKESW